MAFAKIELLIKRSTRACNTNGRCSLLPTTRFDVRMQVGQNFRAEQWRIRAYIYRRCFYESYSHLTMGVRVRALTNKVFTLCSHSKVRVALIDLYELHSDPT